MKGDIEVVVTCASGLEQGKACILLLGKDFAIGSAFLYIIIEYRRVLGKRGRIRLPVSS